MSIQSKIINAYIAESIENNKFGISVNNLVDVLMNDSDCKAAIEEVDREDLERRYYGAFIRVYLNAIGYRSVIRGKGIYIDVEKSDNPAYVAKVLENAGISVKDAEQAVLVIKKAIKANPKINGQLQFDMDGNCIVSLSDEELLEQLLQEVM